MLSIFRARTDEIHQVKVDMSECIGRRFPLTVAGGDCGQDEAGKYEKEIRAGIGVQGNSVKQRWPRQILDLDHPQTKSHNGHGRQAAQDLQRVVPVPFHAMPSLRARMLLSWAVR
ncbi:hypothetical protein IAE57_03245 [Stenotrophomonas sp. S48]|uniref:hypothetical protein n=1 Tax=unclassified Stenotrophomonas TaxID=196198 RepID=UPI0019021FBB|nr:MULTISPECIES: hypothetical protein [unclassified Stenotrophomonas]MBK0025167.1 hypothetical protein [Stenotrophomonas sp. S48]MBK0046792.1 hypothetical protein [Stenotrophomonas sp. S49]